MRGIAVLLCAWVAGLACGWGICAWQAQPAADARPLPSAIDIGFAQAMMVHHQQAVEMAQLMLDGKPTQLARIARQIAASQLLEWGELRGWLKLWEAPFVPESGRLMDWMLLGARAPDAALTQYLLDCQRAPTGMAGMASDAALMQLRDGDGGARDRLFVRLMLAHHQAAIPMIEFALAEARIPAVRALATQMFDDQSREIRQLLLTQAALRHGSAVTDEPDEAVILQHIP